MGSLEVGSLLLGTVGQIKVGSSNVQAIYAGSTLVFPQPTTTTTTTTTSTTTTTTTTAIPVYACNATINPYSGDPVKYTLGTTSGTVTISSDITPPCPAAGFVIYYPAVISPSNVIYSTTGLTGEFNYVYDGTNTDILVVYDTSSC